MTLRQAVFVIVAIALAAASQPTAHAQSSTGSLTPAPTQAQLLPQVPQQTPPVTSSSPVIAHLDLEYHRPTQREKLHNYAFDSFGPFAFAGSAFSAAIAQGETASKAHNAGIPPDWGQGWDSYGARFGSDFGINLITQTARYTLAEAFREDTIFYRCECTGFLPRLKHALISTVTARRGEDGHRVLSFPAIAAPFAGTEAAALLWYPSRYDAMDGARAGSYNLLAQAALNLALEFVYGGPHTLLSHHHVPVISNATGSHPDPQ
ncbi:MAG TPA: hypothetical protein VN861_12175 [Candidatus Acidoferrales bacterium]|nr:hypothetical protein [Candidatus Acidoferrales bacterium]